LPDGVPLGLSQISFLAESDGGFLSQFDYEDEDDAGSASLLKSVFYDLAHAIDVSSEPDSLRHKVSILLQQLLAEARGKAMTAPVSENAKRVSILPQSNKHRKTHSVKHMGTNWN